MDPQIFFETILFSRIASRIYLFSIFEQLTNRSLQVKLKNESSHLCPRIRHRQFPFLRIIVWTGFVKARMAVWIVRATLPRVIGRRKSLLGFRSFEDVWMERERDSEQEEEPWTREREEGLKSWIGQVRGRTRLTVKPCCVYLLELNRWFITTRENWTVQMRSKDTFNKIRIRAKIRRIDPRVISSKLIHRFDGSKNENFWNSN